MNEPIVIEYSADYPGFVLIIASQILDYWEMYGLKSIEVGIEKISERLNEN
jgi:hypothetical protein